MARLIAKTSGVGLTEIELKLGTNKFGRAPENDFQILHPTVSSAHCEMVFLNGTLEVRDLNSTNGTFIDGHPIKLATFEPGQTLRLGSVDFELRDELYHVAIPELGTTSSAAMPALPEGAWPCANHPGTIATVQCVQCERMYCDACLKELHRVGGKSLKLCPECSGQVTPLVMGAIQKSRMTEKKNALLARLKHTFRLPSFRRR
ncbi:MAG: FHA domain-containing protein [Verrucomicrobia bacterium]|nr:FHA domain-containing protein [Verrucomicrobiota bacterium]